MDKQHLGGHGVSPLDELIARSKTRAPGAVLELWEAVRRFIEMKARERTRAGSRVPFDDLTQAGFLAVLDAADQYDPGRENASFLSLLCFTLQSQWAEEAGTRTTRRDALQYADSTETAAHRDDPDGPTVGELLPDDGAALAFMGVEYRNRQIGGYRNMDTAINHVDTQMIIAFIARKHPGIMEQVSLLKISQDQENDACLIFDFYYKEKQRGGLDYITAVIVLAPDNWSPVDLPIFEQMTAPSN